MTIRYLRWPGDTECPIPPEETHYNSGWHRHPNGGGWVSDCSVVDDDCMISVESSISDHSVVSSGSVVMDGSVIHYSVVIDSTVCGSEIIESTVSRMSRRTRPSRIRMDDQPEPKPNP